MHVFLSPIASRAGYPLAAYLGREPGRRGQAAGAFWALTVAWRVPDAAFWQTPVQQVRRSLARGLNC